MTAVFFMCEGMASARLAQSAERKALNLVVVGSSPTVGVLAVKGPFILVADVPAKRQGSLFACILPRITFSLLASVV